MSTTRTVTGRRALAAATIGDDGTVQVILYQPEGAYVFAVDT